MTEPWNLTEAQRRQFREAQIAAKRSRSWTHKGCGQPVVFDMSGGFCTGCHAENLDDDDVNAPAADRECNCTCQIPGAHDPDCAVYGPPEESTAIGTKRPTEDG